MQEWIDEEYARIAIEATKALREGRTDDVMHLLGQQYQLKRLELFLED